MTAPPKGNRSLAAESTSGSIGIRERLNRVSVQASLLANPTSASTRQPRKYPQIASDAQAVRIESGGMSS